jgi:hypothetical protein
MVCVIAVYAGAHLGSDGGLSRSRAAVRCDLGGTPDPLPQVPELPTEYVSSFSPSDTQGGQGLSNQRQGTWVVWVVCVVCVAWVVYAHT